MPNRGAIGTKLSQHLIGRHVVAQYGRCAGCNCKTYYFKGEKLRIREGKNYCRSCFQQILHGVKVEFKPKIQPICKVCGIGKLYADRCYICFPNKIETKEIIDDRAKVAKEAKKPITNFTVSGVLKSGLIYCQYVKCRKIFSTTEEIVKRGRIGTKFRFCSLNCSGNFERENEGFILK